MSKKKTKFQLGDHVTYSNKRGKYSYIGQIIAQDGRYCVIDILSSEGNVRYVGPKEVSEYGKIIPEEFTNIDYTWATIRRSNSSNCVWDSSQFLHHVTRPYDVGQNGDTDEDI